MQFKTRNHGKQLVCSDCGLPRPVSLSELNAAARPRCLACGGPMNSRRELNGKPPKREPNANPRQLKRKRTKTKTLKCVQCGQVRQIPKNLRNVAKYARCLSCDGNMMPKPKSRKEAAGPKREKKPKKRVATASGSNTGALTDAGDVPRCSAGCRTI